MNKYRMTKNKALIMILIGCIGYVILFLSIFNKEKAPAAEIQNLERVYIITQSDISSVPYGLHTIEYEGCEYIIYKDGSAGSVQMIHKHNCKFCKE